MFKFETLEIWKESVKFVKEIYDLTKKFPNWETYNITSQLTRAALSTSLNIAEGSSRKSKLDFKRFIQISTGSVYEVITCLFIAKDQKYITDEDFKIIYKRCEELSKMLYGFSAYLDKP